MGIGLSGMISGMDTDSIVQAMVSAQRTKSTKIENKITLNKWTTEAWSGLNTKIYSFYTKYASKLRLQSSFMTRTAKSSNEDVATATAGSNAAVGTHTLKVNSLASSQYVTSGKLAANDKNASYNKNSKLTEIGAAGVAAGTIITITGKKGTADEVVKKLEVTDTTTVNDFLNACKDAGLTANFDEKQQRFFISSSQSGSKDAFSITTAELSPTALTTFNEIEESIDTSLLSETEKTAYDEAMSMLRQNLDIIETVLSDTYVEVEGDKTQKAVHDAINVVKNAAVKTHENNVATEAKETATGEENQKIEENLLKAVTAGTGDSASGLSALGLGKIDGNAVPKNPDDSTGNPDDSTGNPDDSTGNPDDSTGDLSDSTGMVVVAATDCEYVLDGATMRETSNNFTVNGITLNFADTTKDKETGEHKPIQITVGKDADSSYKLVKEALTEYNKLIEEMNKLYNADSARGYDPLTDEQKEAMTEDDIKNWEDKIKSSLLRRDDSLGSLLTSMRSALSSTYTDEESGKTYSLSTFGIVTGNYTEKGKLHIYGDEDDATYATYEDRLKKALEEDPDQVMEVLTNVFGKLYDTMTEKCAKTEISSALTFYNDKQYKNLLSGYEDDLDKMEDRIKDLEDKYYKQFTAMETALSKLQSQTNSLASLLGSGTAQ